MVLASALRVGDLIAQVCGAHLHPQHIGCPFVSAIQSPEVGAVFRRHAFATIANYREDVRSICEPCLDIEYPQLD
jgi:hypothetical protein